MKRKYFLLDTLYYKLLLLIIFCVTLFIACNKVDLFEKNVSFKDHEWKNNVKPSFTFTITDTTVPYQLFLILRHNEKYNYNNIWINLHTKTPGSTVAQKAQYELPLATNEKGWLGVGMDDIYEHRIPLTPPANDSFYFNQRGPYTFTIEQIMREDPLQNVMNVGLRIERKK